MEKLGPSPGQTQEGVVPKQKPQCPCCDVCLGCDQKLTLPLERVRGTEAMSLSHLQGSDPISGGLMVLWAPCSHPPQAAWHQSPEPRTHVSRPLLRLQSRGLGVLELSLWAASPPRKPPTDSLIYSPPLLRTETSLVPPQLPPLLSPLASSHSRCISFPLPLPDRCGNPRERVNLPRHQSVHKPPVQGRTPDPERSSLPVCPQDATNKLALQG